MIKFGIIVFPGSNCDRDVAMVTQGLFGQPTRMVWHQDTDLTDIDVVVIPGGFSYGDYLRCGAIARFSPVMTSILDHARQGKFVLGICNGFQILTEVGLLPGALIRNRDLHFICDRVPLTIARTDVPWTNKYTNSTITLPIAHGEGRYYAQDDILQSLEDHQQVIFRYADPAGQPTPTANPNGSLNNIAGIMNSQGNVLGMMPHPERAIDQNLGNADGQGIFEGLIQFLT